MPDLMTAAEVEACIVKAEQSCPGDWRYPLVPRLCATVKHFAELLQELTIDDFPQGTDEEKSEDAWLEVMSYWCDKCGRLRDKAVATLADYDGKKAKPNASGEAKGGA